MALAPEQIVAVAQAILDRLSHRDTRWTVAEVIAVDESGFTDPVLVRVAKIADPSCTVSSYFSQGIPTQPAIAQLASSLQDEVIETVSAAVPVCPGHPHPQSARVEDGRAVWVCPLGTGPKESITAP